jgi:glucokinase
MSQPLCLVADVGGTNTRVALAEGTRLRPQSVARFRNAEHTDLGAVLGAYLAGADLGADRVEAACAAAAGPVQNGVAHLTNLDWQIDGDLLRRVTGAGRVAILNDLQAQGHALGHIDPHYLRPILAGPQVAGASMLVVGVGTGFNAAPVHDIGRIRLVPPSESGHVNLPLVSDEDVRLARFIEARHGFAGVEEALSGRGLEHLYAFAASEHADPAVPHQRPAAEIPAAIAAGDPIAQRAGEIFARMMGLVVSNLALTNLPYGGIYLAGGVARAMAPVLLAGGFGATFTGKGRFSEFLRGFSVRLIEDDYAALTGCAAALAFARYKAPALPQPCALPSASPARIGQSGRLSPAQLCTSRLRVCCMARSSAILAAIRARWPSASALTSAEARWRSS